MKFDRMKSSTFDKIFVKKIKKFRKFFDLKSKKEKFVSSPKDVVHRDKISFDRSLSVTIDVKMNVDRAARIETKAFTFPRSR